MELLRVVVFVVFVFRTSADTQLADKTHTMIHYGSGFA